MRAFYLALTVLLFLLLQAVVAPRISLGPVSPDFISLAVIFFAFHRGPVPGALFGFVVGFIQDLGNPDLLGLGALVGSLLGYLVGRAGKKTFTENVLAVFGLFFAGILGRDAVYLAFVHWPRADSALVRTVTQALPSAIYSALIGVLADRVVMRFGTTVETAIGKEGPQ